jgi:hypothetical protein
MCTQCITASIGAFTEATPLFFVLRWWRRVE